MRVGDGGMIFSSVFSSLRACTRSRRMRFWIFVDWQAQREQEGSTVVAVVQAREGCGCAHPLVFASTADDALVSQIAVPRSKCGATACTGSYTRSQDMLLKALTASSWSTANCGYWQQRLQRKPKVFILPVLRRKRRGSTFEQQLHAKMRHRC